VTGVTSWVKAHRQPVDIAALTAAHVAQRLLADAGFPCPRPLSGPDRFEGLVLTTGTLIARGGRASGRRPAVRQTMAAGLAAHIDILRSHAELVAMAGAGPAWCRYQSGPWPTPHDAIFNFRSTPDGFAWLDRLAAEAASPRSTGRWSPTRRR
jgi:hypothetical protein